MRRGLAAFVALVLIAEVGMRMSGMVDFPVYATDAEIGYVPRANQSGAFLNQNRWMINDRGMNVAERFEPSGQHDLLLTGDSVVWGGNPYDQPEKLGSQLQALLPGEKVWPISAGSWSVENVQVWCQRNPDVVREIDTLVWVLNTGDFSTASQWTSELTHPRSPPWSALGFYLNKYGWPKVQRAIPAARPSPKPDETKAVTIDLDSQAKFSEQLAEFSSQGTQCLIVLYPSRDQTEGESKAMQKYQMFREALIAAMADQGELVEVLADDRWSAAMYRDGIHPTPAGCGVLADIIREHLDLAAVSVVLRDRR